MSALIVGFLLLLSVSGLAYLSYQKWEGIISTLMVLIWGVYITVLISSFVFVIIGAFMTGDAYIMLVASVITVIGIWGLLSISPQESIKESINKIKDE